ncbi:hypothetical protein LZL87_012040 [Fusarium oxysporum]|nr:hypothetical protein LZL87_012040 [Fusarium oxysporum]
MMASQEPDDNPVTLNQPCKFCKVLEVDDSSFGGESKTSDDGTPFVDFGKLDYSRVDTLPELPGLASSSAAGCALCEAFRHGLMVAWKSIEEKEEQEEEESPEPEENDSDAESEGEKAGNDAGDGDDIDEEGPVSDEDTNKPICEDIDTDSDAESEPDAEPDEEADDANVQAEDSNDSGQENQEEPATKRAPRNGKLIIAEFTFRLQEHGSDDERPQRIWLDALYGFFTIECEGKTRDYSIHYTIYADRADHCSSWFDIGHRPIMNDQLSKASLSRMKELILLSEKERAYELVKAQTICSVELLLGVRLGDDAIHDHERDSGRTSIRHLDGEGPPDGGGFNTDDSCSSGFLKKDYAPPNFKIDFHSKLNSAISGLLNLRMLLPPSETVRKCTHEDGKYGRVNRSPGDIDLEHAAWRTRGRTFQEDQLAPRKVFFGNHMFHVSRGSSLEAADGSSIGHFQLMEGIDSVEKGLKRFPDQNYLAGLWEPDIHVGLLWRCPAWMGFDFGEVYRTVLELGSSTIAVHERPEYMLCSKRKRFMAKILFDWDSYCALNEGEYPRGPMSDISLLLAASILPGNALMMKSRDLPDVKRCSLGLSLGCLQKRRVHMKKSGLWYTEDREKGEQKFWRDVPMQYILLV